MRQLRKGDETMEFRPCIDIHNGKVKQIVGGTLKDAGDRASENFVSEQDAAFYAEFYKKDGIRGGHIILLNSVDSEYYEKTKEQAFLALRTYPGGLQVGGGITPDNAAEYLEAGASHVIVTSYVFRNGQVNMEHLQRLVDAVGREHLVLDLSCRRKGDDYYIVTDRWQKFTDVCLTPEVLDELAGYCSEFLIHAVDVEGKARGIERPLVQMLGDWSGLPVTYAGGVGSFADLQELKTLGQGHLNVTIGSALDLFGGTMKYEEVVKFVAD
jgi:phosphoribosylformimino-5-aminoimidazole carboxamide ribotide isomerase